jgi:hypothetical protein
MSLKYSQIEAGIAEHSHLSINTQQHNKKISIWFDFISKSSHRLSNILSQEDGVNACAYHINGQQRPNKSSDIKLGHNKMQ